MERPLKTSKASEELQASTKQPLEGINMVLLDIEGTICPITFVKDTLFPYALSALPSHLDKHWSSATLAPYISAFPAEHATCPAALLAHVRDLTARDVKAPYLKSLQGYLWEDGYRSHAYAAPVYTDVLEFLDRWPTNATGTPATVSPQANPAPPPKQVAIYSSGSIFAQKLLLEHVQGPSSSSSTTNTNPTATLDKRLAIAAYFDTVTAGPKQESSSYGTIADAVRRRPAEVLFLSDNVHEVRAALQAGMKSIVVDREGNAPLSEEERREFEVVTSFEQLGLS